MSRRSTRPLRPPTPPYDNPAPSSGTSTVQVPSPRGGFFGRPGIRQAKPDLGVEIIEDLLRPLPAHGGFGIGEALHGEEKPRVGAPRLY